MLSIIRRMGQTQKRIVFTGGPSGGKTSIIDMVLRRFGKKVVVVPEAATILYAGGFPRKPGPEPMRHIQRAIYYTVRELEDLTALTSEAPIALCDAPKVGRNDACSCGSGKKYKKCCGKNAQ